MTPDGIFTLIAAIISTIGTVASVWLGRRYMKRKKIDPVVEDTLQSTNIYMALEYMLQEMEADRAYVLQFHNGGHYYSGRGQQKFSCTHETATEGITREYANSQEHRVSHYHGYINELITEERFAYTVTHEIEDKAFALMLQQAGVKSIYNVPIKTFNGKIIGILGLDYVKNPAQKNIMGFGTETGSATFDDETATFMKRQSQMMAGYLV